MHKYFDAWHSKKVLKISTKQWVFQRMCLLLYKRLVLEIRKDLLVTVEEVNKNVNTFKLCNWISLETGIQLENFAFTTYYDSGLQLKVSKSVVHVVSRNTTGCYFASTKTVLDRS